MWCLLSANATFAYSHADSLRGSHNAARDWWKVKYYNLSVEFDTATKSISGENTISLLVTKKPIDSMQIDLQEHMQIDSVIFVINNDDSVVRNPINFKKQGNAGGLLISFRNGHKAVTKTFLYIITANHA